MKKVFKLLAAFGMISLMASFVSCSLLTEAELIEKNKQTPGPNNGGGSSSILWSKFDGASMQVWKGEVSKKETAKLKETTEGLEITIGSEGWWGMCFCNDASVGANVSDVVTFDMSAIDKITFEAKASEVASMWVSQSDASSTVVNQQKIELTNEFATKTFTLSNPGKRDYGVLDIGGGDLATTTKSDVVITIKNIKFFTADGTETVPNRNK